MYTSKVLTKIWVLLSIFSVGFLASCGSEKPKDELEDKPVATEETMTKDAIDKLRKGLDNMPSPVKVLTLIQRTGVDFDPKAVNPVSNVENYKTTSETAAINLGVYSADLAYLSVFGQTQDALSVAKAGHQLAAHLQLEGSQEKVLLQEFEKHVENQDSLVNFVENVYAAYKLNLKTPKKLSTATLVVTGAFVEALYIPVYLVENYPHDLPAAARSAVLSDLVRHILGKKENLTQIVGMLADLKPFHKELAPYHTDLSKLLVQFEDVNIEERIKANDGSLSLDDETLKGIWQEVRKIRATYVK